MKKIIAAILCIGMVTAVSAGCGFEDALAKNASSTKETEATTVAATVDEPKPADFKDSLDGLSEYFVELGYITLKDGKFDEQRVKDMDASLIGAKAGKKFAESYNGKAVYIELYEFDTKNTDKNEVINSVKKDGVFSILDLPEVKAYLSDSGKYMMIYTDESIDDSNPKIEDKNYIRREEVIKNFKKF